MQSRNDFQSTHIFLAYSPGLHPSTYEKLYWRLFKESTQEHLFKFSLSYFNNYVLKKGDREHPILGDLRYFIYQIESTWNEKNPLKIGNNPVVEFLKKNFSQDPELDRLYVNALINSLINPAKEPLQHFKDFFQQSGIQKKHPIFGDLLVFANNIEKHWDLNKGNNLLVTFLRAKLEPNLNPTPTFDLGI